MKKLIFLFCLVSVLAHAQDLIITQVQDLSEAFIMGADVSSLAQIEECGGIYYDEDGAKKDMLLILKEKGLNWIRLRLWNNPVNSEVVKSGDKILSNKGDPVGGGNNNLERTISIARRAKELDFKILLDFHYSDFWADPGKQTKPAAWKNMKLPQLRKAIYSYTAEVLNTMKNAGVLPDMVQIGNELNSGMLWPEGKTWKDKNDTQIGGMKGFSSLLKEAARAVRELDDKNLKIIIHLADGGDNALYRYIFDALVGAKVDFDIIGLSFYPYWHGSLAALDANLRDITKRYKKPAIIAETAYGFTTEDGDEQGNVFKVFDDGTSGYLATVQGQATMLRDLIAVVAGVPEGLGVFYWEPGWIPVEGAGWRTGEGDNWENQAMFDFNGKALASLAVWKTVYTGSGPTPTPKAAEPITLKITPDKKNPLPTNVKLYYTDDSIHSTPVTWEPYTIPTTETSFTVNGKAAGLTVSANVTVSNQINLVEDPSFENGNIKGWVLNGPAAASFAENNKANAHTGNWTYKYWLDSPFRSILTRNFNNIPNGTYTLSIWAMGGGGENTIKLFAKNASKTISITINNTGWQVWKQYIIPGVEVENGSCTIGIFIDAKAENWGNFDDIEFYKN